MSGARHLAAPTARTGQQRLMIVVGAALTVLLLAGAGAIGWFNYRLAQIERIDVSIDVPPASGEPRNYLLVGSDSRAGLDEDDPANAVFFDDEGTVTAEGAKRTDTIMVLRVDPEAERAYLLSFPRDLYVPIAGKGDRNRINVAYTRGREVLIDTIRQSFGIPIHHYVEVDFVGFLGLVEAVGGVPFYFDTPVRDTHSGLDVPEVGCVTLNSRQSLSFARSRYLEYRDVDSGRWRTDPSGDLGRISRQQAFIKRAVAKAVSKGLSNPATLNELVDVAVDYVALDPTLSVRDLIGLGRRFAAFDAETLQTYSLPTEPFRTSGGAEVLDLLDRQAEPILNIFRGLDPDEVTPGLVDVTVLNGTGAQGYAADITAALDTLGFTTSEPGDTKEPFAQSVIYYPEGGEAHAIRLAQHLTADVEFVVDDDLEIGEVGLVAGADFTTIHEQPSPTVPQLPTTTSSTTTTEAPSGGDTSTSTTVAPGPTTSTTAPIGYLPGQDAEGIVCS